MTMQREWRYDVHEIFVYRSLFALGEEAGASGLFGNHQRVNETDLVKTSRASTMLLLSGKNGGKLTNAIHNRSEFNSSDWVC